MHTFFRKWRWWWTVAVLMAVVITPIVYITESQWIALSSLWKYIMGTLMIFMAGILGLWTFAVAPLLSASDMNPRWTTPPAYHLNTLILAVWTPTIIFVVCCIWLDVIPYIIKGSNTGNWHFRFELWMSAVIPILALCITYGWYMSRIIKKQFALTTTLRHICLVCGYNLKGISSKYCPECGEPALTQNEVILGHGNYSESKTVK